MEELFGTMIQEMSSREAGGGNDGSSSSQDASSDDGEEGQLSGSRERGWPRGDAAGRSASAGLRRCTSAPVLSMRGPETAPSEASSYR